MASVIDSVVNLAKRRGLVYPCGEIYGGTRSAWDYGPLGVELKENIKRQWWQSVVTGRDDVVGLDSSIILPRDVWVASGHVEVFHDPLVECLQCHKRHRQDHMQEAHAEKKSAREKVPVDPDSVSMEDIVCPDCGTKGQWTEPREFNMMLKTYLGPIESEEGLHYLRPETAQGIFVNFANVVTTSRKKPPFGIGQIGKSFRNEITPGNFIFRTREFEQMEMEFFVEPDTAKHWHQYWIDTRLQWYVDLGIARDNLRLYEHPKEKLSHYSDGTTDIEYKFGFHGNPWGELEGIANRTNFDLSTHSKHSGVDLSFYDQATDNRYIPYVIEPAAGLTRSFMAFLVDAYAEDEAPNAKGGVDKRTVLRLDPRLAPVKAAVLPLSRNADLSPKARDLAAELRKNWNVEFDDAGAIGRRYRRQDEIGTPFCVTVDFDTLEDQAVTVRDRDAMTQERVGLNNVVGYLATRLAGGSRTVRRFVDISVPLQAGIVSDPPGHLPEIDYYDHRQTAEEVVAFFPGASVDDLPDGEGWAIERVRITTHNGTHLDAPYHYSSTMDASTSSGRKRAITIDEVPLEWCLQPAVKLDFRAFPDGYVATASDVEAELARIGHTLSPLEIVLVNTAAGTHYGQPDYVGKGCGMGREATLYLLDRGVRLTGTDAWSWDAPFSFTAQRYARDHDPSVIWEGHRAGRAIGYCHIEKLNNLELLPPNGFEVACFPVKIHAASAGWTRAVAIFED